VHVRGGTDAGVRPPASVGGEYGDSRTVPFELVSIGHGDVVVVSQRNQCLCPDPNSEYVLDRVGALGIERQSWHDPAGAGSPPPTFKYVALGDSIAAGEGQGNADGYPNNASAYPAMLGRLLNADVYNLAISGACSATAGATSPGIGKAHTHTAESCTKSVLNTQLPQLFELGVTPDVITLTVGGNDIQFAKCFEAVLGLSDDNPCEGQTFSDHLAALRTNLRQALDLLRQRYPNADILITTQFNPLPGDAINSDATPCAQMPLLYVIDRIRAGKYKQLAEALLFGELDSKGLQFQLDRYAEANRVLGRLNKSLRTTAEQYGATVVPLDFTGHDFCRGYNRAGQSWVLSPNIRLSVDVERRLHTESFERFYTPLEKCTPLPDCNGFSKVDGGSFSVRFVLTGHYQYTFVANDFPHLTVAGANAVARMLHSHIQP
jgi:lysophospholipase L1-like esterase